MTSSKPEHSRYYARDRAAWRRWLQRNHARAAGVWLVRYKAASGKPCVTYEASVEEALCFGWIDGKVRSIDEEHYIQMFTPRRPKSVWSATNKRRIDAMIAAGLMTPAGLGAIAVAKANGMWSALDGVEALTVPPELERALARNAKARRNFEAFAPSARKSYLYWLAGAKRPETRAKRIGEIVRLAAENRKLQDAMPFFGGKPAGKPES